MWVFYIFLEYIECKGMSFTTQVLFSHLLISLTALGSQGLPEEVSLSSGSYFLVKEEVNRHVNPSFKVRFCP